MPLFSSGLLVLSSFGHFLIVNYLDIFAGLNCEVLDNTTVCI